MKEVFQCGNEEGKAMTALMPAKNGYPYKVLYHQAKELMDNTLEGCRG